MKDIHFGTSPFIRGSENMLTESDFSFQPRVNQLTGNT